VGRVENFWLLEVDGGLDWFWRVSMSFWDVWDI
jgi:hypothetical protein